MTDAEFDLAKQMRIAEAHRRIAMKLGDERVMREHLVSAWAVGFGLAFIIGGLALAMELI